MDKKEKIDKLIERLKELDNIPLCIKPDQPKSDQTIIIKLGDSVYKLILDSSLADYLFRSLEVLEEDEVNFIYSNIFMNNFSIDINTWKKKNGYTDEDLDFMWDFCAEFKHPTIKNMNDNGIRWNRLSYFALLSLPKVYEDVRNSVIFDDFS